ncbi:MAG: HepT-like ribonuclease domain-containing protein [bacterium]
MPPERWQDRIDDILIAISKIQRYVAGSSFETFKTDEKTVDAVVRNLSIIGEAARHVPPEVQARAPTIPWAEMRGIVETGHRVDFILSFSAYQQEAFARTRNIVINNVAVTYASAEDVIVYKMIAGRPRDLEDVTSIVAKIQALDTDYLTRWLRIFETDLARPLEEPLRQLLRGRPGGRAT